MDSAMIGKIQKAKRYAAETDRIVFQEFKVTMQGDNDEHTLSYDKGEWHCDCYFFSSRGRCSHTMTMERVLDGMIPPEW